MYRIAQGFAAVYAPSVMVIGHDIRPTSPEFAMALADGFMDAGVDVIHIGQCGTEQVYFATSHYETSGGMMVTASHNPIDYNGVKIVGEGCKPVSWANGLDTVEEVVRTKTFNATKAGGKISHRSCADIGVAWDGDFDRCFFLIRYGCS